MIRQTQRSPHEAGSGSRLGGGTSDDHTTTDGVRERPFILQWRSAVLNASLTSTQKLCLLVLAEWAEQDGSDCFPAIESIAEKAGVNEKTVRRSLDSTALLGWFTRQHRQSTRGWKHFNYTLMLPLAVDTRPARSATQPGMVSGANKDAPDTESTRTGDLPDTVSTAKGESNACTGLSVPLHRTLCPDAPGTESTEVSNELGEEVGERSLFKQHPVDRFSEFWKAYPRKDAKKAAEKIWERKKLDQSADRIIADVAARIADPGQWTDPKFIPYATTYLNQVRWMDEWSPQGGLSPAGVIERDHRSEAEIEAENERQLARFGLGAVAA